MNAETITYKGETYAVFEVGFKEYKLPVVMNNKDFKMIQKIGKKWKCNKNGSIYCSHVYKKIPKDVYLHDVVMNIKNDKNHDKILTRPIIHINNISLDNRRENLVYDIADKEFNKNIRKKKRTVELPMDSGIIPDEIPTYVWYMKPNGSHGERFMVSIGDIVWKTTSSTQHSLKYKLEQAKGFLRKLKTERPDLFENYSMNGDMTKEGKNQYNKYFDIIRRAGYHNIKQSQFPNATKQLLRPDEEARFDPFDSYGSDHSDSPDTDSFRGY